MKRIVLDKDIGGDDGITAAAFRTAWPQGETEVEILIDSMGGSCIDGAAIAEIIKEKRNEGCKVHGKIQGICGSVATLIALACTDVSITPGSQFFIHEAQADVNGTADEHEAAAQGLKLFNEQMLKAYSEKTKMSPEQIADLMKKETMMNANQAKELGFVDKMINYTYNMVAKLKKSREDAQAHIYITVNQAEESPGAVQNAETEAGEAEEGEKEKIVVEEPAKTVEMTEEKPAEQEKEVETETETTTTNVPSKEMEDMKSELQKMKDCYEEMKAKCESLEKDNALMKNNMEKAETDMRQSKALAQKLTGIPVAHVDSSKTVVTKQTVAGSNTLQVF